MTWSDDGSVMLERTQRRMRGVALVPGSRDPLTVTGARSTGDVAVRPRDRAIPIRAQPRLTLVDEYADDPATSSACSIASSACRSAPRPAGRSRSTLPWRRGTVIDVIRDEASGATRRARLLPLEEAHAATRGLHVDRCARRGTSPNLRDEWTCIGRTADLPNKGDYLTADILRRRNTPAAIARSSHYLRTRNFAVFDNVCVHRARPLLQGCGNEPHHGPYTRVYRLDGQLIGAPYMNAPLTRANLERADHHSALRSKSGGILLSPSIPMRIARPDG
jgi:hypothetical protein